jgi:HlyD family secretion protein
MPAASNAKSSAPVALVSERPTPLQPRKRLRGGVVVVAVAAGLAVTAGAIGIWYWLAAGPAVRYTQAVVSRGDVMRTVTATGTVNPVLTVIVGSYVSGVIKEVTCDYNTKVRQGQVCAKIDPGPYQTVVDQNRANLEVAKAQLEKDKANLANAQLSYDRSAHLARTGTASKETLDNAKNLLDQAKAQVGIDEAMIKQREAQLASAEVNLGYTQIVSPVDGTVVSRNVTIGQTVAASFQTPTLFLIAADLSKMQVDANVSESDIGGIQVGNKATFTVGAFQRRIFEGSVAEVRQSPQTVQNVVTYDVVVSVDNLSSLLKPGMTASTSIILDERHDVLRVPSQSLRYLPAGTTRDASTGARNQGHVWVLRDGIATAIPVKVGLDDGGFAEILDGALREGDKIIVSEQRATSGTSSTLLRPRF